jgi:hypothetical protein
MTRLKRNANDFHARGLCFPFFAPAIFIRFSGTSLRKNVGHKLRDQLARRGFAQLNREIHGRERRDNLSALGGRCNGPRWFRAWRFL